MVGLRGHECCCPRGGERASQGDQDTAALFSCLLPSAVCPGRSSGVRSLPPSAACKETLPRGGPGSPYNRPTRRFAGGRAQQKSTRSLRFLTCRPSVGPAAALASRLASSRAPIDGYSPPTASLAGVPSPPGSRVARAFVSALEARCSRSRASRRLLP